jgi:hypothetical protein
MTKKTTQTKVLTRLRGTVIRRPMASGFPGSFFIKDKSGQKFLVAPSRVFANEVLKHLSEGDAVEIETISAVKPETMLYAHEVRFRGYDLTTLPPTY